VSGTYRSLVKLVVFIIVTTALTLVLGATIGNVAVANTRPYHAVFADATGLNAGDDVRIAGVRVGQVKSVKVVDKRYADVTFAVQKKIQLLASTNVAVRYLNLVGQRYLALSERPGNGEILKKNAVIPLTQTTPPLDLTALFNGFKPLFRALTPQDVNSLSYEVIQVLQGEGGTVDQLLAHTASLTNTIADRDHVVGEVVSNLNVVLTTVAQRDQGLSELLLQLQRLVSGLSGDRDIIATSVGRIDALAGSTASLLADIRPSLKVDIAQLNKVAGTLATTSDPATGQNTLDAVLKRMPDKVTAILRTATYGSWFNFFLCSAQAEPLPAHIHSAVPSCAANK
jgi:phospholipid/cholesterol/gamma-HCH transport system substrate-binding protein